MDQDKSHTITPTPDEVKPNIPRPKTEREKKQEREQALISRERCKPGKAAKKGPLSVGVDFDHAKG